MNRKKWGERDTSSSKWHCEGFTAFPQCHVWLALQPSHAFQVFTLEIYRNPTKKKALWERNELSDMNWDQPPSAWSKRASITTWHSLRALLLAVPQSSQRIYKNIRIYDVEGNIWLRSVIVISVLASSLMLPAQPMRRQIQSKSIQTGCKVTGGSGFVSACLAPAKQEKGKSCFSHERVYFQKAPCQSVDLAPNVQSNPLST